MRLYTVLGVSADASESEIKAAYRKLAREFHPDSGNPGDVARFREVQEAYETLSDFEKRRSYDRGWKQPFPVSWTGGFEEPLAPFHEVTPPRREAPSLLDIVLTVEEATRGGDLVLEVANDIDCPECSATGFGFYGYCPACSGAGVVRARETIRFRIPRGAESGGVVTARSRDGVSVRARIRVVTS